MPYLCICEQSPVYRTMDEIVENWSHRHCLTVNSWTLKSDKIRTFNQTTQNEQQNSTLNNAILVTNLFYLKSQLLQLKVTWKMEFTFYCSFNVLSLNIVHKNRTLVVINRKCIFLYDCLLSGTLSTTIALYVGLLLTGLYALLGSKYLKDAQHVLETYRDANYNPVLLPQHTERFLRLSCQFTYVYFTSSIILVALGLASFVQGTMAYFTNPVYTSNQGSTPAIAGIAALLVNLFISACLMGECFQDVKSEFQLCRRKEMEIRPVSAGQKTACVRRQHLFIRTIIVTAFKCRSRGLFNTHH